MARQSGSMKIQGTIGDLTFYKSGDRYLVRRKGGPRPDLIAGSPNFIRSRENSSEFGTASKAGKLVRFCLKSLVKHASDGGLCNRLTTELLKVIKSDPMSVRGKRSIVNGKLELLQGFEFNTIHKLSMTLRTPYKNNINRDTGKVFVSMPPFIPVNMITAPESATYFTITAGAAEIDFQANTFVVDTKKTAQLPFNSLPTDEIKLELNITQRSTLPLFVVLGIEFYERVDDVLQMVPRDYNSLALVAVSS